MSHDEMFEAALETGEFANERDEFGHGEFGNEMEAFEGEFEGEGEGEGEGEWEGEGEGEYEGLNESHEVALASELLEVSNEQELEQFLGGLMKKIGGVARGIINTPAGGALKGLLKSAARRGLPMLGRAVGGYFGGSTGAKVGGTLGRAAGQVFGLELEGLSHEDREFEVARRYVRFANAAIRRTPSRATPAQVRSIFNTVARRYAPGLRGPVRRPAGRPTHQTQGRRQRSYRPSYNGGSAIYANGGGGQDTSSASQDANGASQDTNDASQDGVASSGQWVRRGDRIVLFGV